MPTTHRQERPADRSRQPQGGRSAADTPPVPGRGSFVAQCARGRLTATDAQPTPGLAALVTVLFTFCGTPVLAAEFGMTCERAGKSYKVSYDTTSRSFRTDNPQIGSRFRLNRVQVDQDAALVWVTALNFGTERDVLVQFGREKWVKYFFGNGSEVTDRCR